MLGEMQNAFPTLAICMTTRLRLQTRLSILHLCAHGETGVIHLDPAKGGRCNSHFGEGLCVQPAEQSRAQVLLLHVNADHF